jgi:hypothetical protein
MGQYFNVKVQFRTESDNGKVKKETINYLVDAQSVTEAEARTVQYLLSRDEEAFEVKSAAEAKIAEVILVDTPEAEAE